MKITLDKLNLKVFALLLLFVPMFLLACQDNSQYQQLEKEVKEGIGELQREISKQYDEKEAQISEFAEKEIENTFAVEYKVIELDAKLSPEELSEKLNEVGKERWKCFFVDRPQNVGKEQSEAVYRIFCNRRPKSYLRYLGKMPGLLPLVSGLGSNITGTMQ